MHDRRVVRGNTFAALVIPVNMQSDMRAQSQQQNKRPRIVKHAYGENVNNLNQSKDYSQRNKGGTLSQNRSSRHSARNSNTNYQAANDLYDELSDYENMVNEDLLEADYHIDRAELAVFIPIPKGLDKATNLNDRQDADLYDFDLEVEPILQVLVGKSLELARIEVIEDFEIKELKKHNAIFKKIRDSELLYTQQEEAKNNRFEQELDMRNVQEIALKEKTLTAQKKQISRIVGKDFIKDLKRYTLRSLVDNGLLRDLRSTDIEYVLIPTLIQSITFVKAQDKENRETVDTFSK